MASKSLGMIAHAAYTAEYKEQHSSTTSAGVGWEQLTDEIRACWECAGREAAMQLHMSILGAINSTEPEELFDLLHGH